MFIYGKYRNSGKGIQDPYYNTMANYHLLKSDIKLLL